MIGVGDYQGTDKEGVYPWCTAWPPPAGVGNLSGRESASPFKLDEYRDEHPFTAPVGRYTANRLGLCDLAGNAWEWCEDWYKPTKKVFRVVCGGSWNLNSGINLRSSCRNFVHPTFRVVSSGFRLVVAVGVGG